LRLGVRTMGRDNDDLTPSQQGKIPRANVLRRRERGTASGRGRLLRPRSWLTLVVGLIAMGVALLLLTRA
jgi:hypothetical protein